MHAHRVRPVALTTLNHLESHGRCSRRPSRTAALPATGSSRCRRSAPTRRPATRGAPAHHHVAGKALDAPCPAGKVALSGGAQTEVDGIELAGNGQVVLNDLTVHAGLGNVRATALEDQDGFARAWQLKTTAICASA